ncbi:MAG: hypothetical protein KGJ86_01875 [Chloroflexota bacterium]|nr:hypothetical protein [Chloroflexota bacterium]
MSDREPVTFRVVQPRQATYHYVWDPQQLRLRADRLARPEHQLPADYGVVQSRTWGHALMPGLLFGSGPVAPDAVVPGSIIGGLRVASSGDTVLLVANAVDPEWSSADVANDDVWQQAEAAAGLLLPGERTERISAGKALNLVREAQRRARVEAAGRDRSARRAWQALGGAGQRPAELSHTYSPAEYSLWRLPWRFQIYAPDLVVSDERVHYFVHRPESRGGLLKRTAFNEGLLLLTDRQVLFLQDAIPPGLAMARWGYLAKSIALERLQAVEVRRRRSQAQLAITSAGNAGEELTVIPFAAEATEQVELAAELLRPFLPGQQPRALLRLYQVDSPQGLRSVNPAHADAAYVEDNVLAARARFKREARLGEPLLADSLAPPLERGRPARWVAVTRSRLVLATEGAPASLELSFGDLTSIELQYCVRRSFMRVSSGAQRWEIDFYSTWFPAFHGVYFAARQCLAQPLALARKPASLQAAS